MAKGISESLTRWRTVVGTHTHTHTHITLYKPTTLYMYTRMYLSYSLSVQPRCYTGVRDDCIIYSGVPGFKRDFGWDAVEVTMRGRGAELT